MNVQIKKLHKDAVIPVYEKSTDAGLDITAVSIEIDKRAGILTYRTGLSIKLPEGYVGLLFPRDGVYKTVMIKTNSVGIIDSEREIVVKFYYPIDKKYRPYNVGDKFVQLVIFPYPKIEFEEIK